jgi:N6-adenosine-specific RNA methylase IME4
MAAAHAEAFKADVARNGVIVPLDTTPEGVVLDGRHRLRVALELGLKRVPVRVVDPPDQVDYILSAAIHRRHLSESQRAALAIRRADYLKRRAQAAKRKQANLRNGVADVAELPHRGRSRDLAAEWAGVSPRTIQNVIHVREKDPALFEQVETGAIAADRAVKEIARKERYARIGPAPPLPEGTFDLIYADPPWQLGSPSSDRSPEQHYPTLATEQLAQLAVPAANDAILFLWAVTGLLPDALEVIDAWGFTYKTSLIWVKNGAGLGNYLRNRHEQLLLATRGSLPLPVPGQQPESVVEAPRGRHSEKPKRIYELIEQMYPHAQRLELFARGRPRADWSAWGNEVSE